MASCTVRIIPDVVGDGVTDDGPAIQAAIRNSVIAPIRDDFASAITVYLPPTDKFYRVESDLIVDRTLIFEGGSPSARSSGAVKLKFGAGCKAGVFVTSVAAAPANYSGHRSILRNLVLSPIAEGTVDFGVIHNTTATFEGVSAIGFRKAGFFAHGQTSGNTEYGDPNGAPGKGTMVGSTNHSVYRQCITRLTTEGHGFAAQGNNTQIMLYDTCDADGNNGCGFLDNSAIGNTYLNCHTAQNTIKILCDGAFYMPIKQHQATVDSRPGTGSDWKRYWTPVVATVADSDWAEGAVYRAAGGINIIAPTARTAIYSHYTEGGIEYGIIPRGGSTVYSGVGADRVLTHPESGNSEVVGGGKRTPVRWKGTEFGASLGRTNDAPTGYEAGHTDDPDVTVPGVKGIHFTYSRVRQAYEWVKGTSKRVMSFTTDKWALNGYTGAGNVFFENGLIVGGPKSARIRAAYNIGNISAGSSVVTGEIFILTNDPKFAMAKVTKGGVVGVDAVIKGFGVIDQ